MTLFDTNVNWAVGVVRRTVLRRYARTLTGDDADDAINGGLCGLWEAAKTYSGPPEDFRRRTAKIVRSAAVDRLRSGVGLIAENRRQAKAEARYLRFPDSKTVTEFLDRRAAEEKPPPILPDFDDMVGLLPTGRLRTIITEVYGNGKTCKQVGRQFGVSESRISQLRAKALRILRRKVEKML